MRQLLFILLTISILVSSTVAEVLTKGNSEIEYTITAEKAINLQFTLQSPRSTCKIETTVFDENNKKLMVALHDMKRAKDVFNLPVKAGTYYLELSGNHRCYEKPFTMRLTKVNGNFEQESNNITSTATKMSDSYYYSGYLQHMGQYEDVDFYRIDTNETGELKLLFKHENTGESNFFNFDLLDVNTKDILSMKSELITDETTQNIGLKKGTYFIKVFTDFGTSNVKGLEYKVAYIFKKTTLTETEPNDKVTQASSIVDGEYINGYFHMKDSVDKDYYKYNAIAGKYTLIFEHEVYENISNVNFLIYDANQKIVKDVTIDGSQLRKSFTLDLKNGLYYIELNTSYTLGDGSKYKFKLIKH